MQNEWKQKPTGKVSAQATPAEVTKKQQRVVGEGYRVVLFNDEVHSMKEVCAQIMKAIGCARNVAETIMMRAHMNGHAVVIIGTKTRAQQVARVLREIALHVLVDQV